MNIVRKRSYTVTQEQESLHKIIKDNYGEIKKIEDVIRYLEQFNLLVSMDLYKGDTLLLPNLPSYLKNSDPAYIKYSFKRNDTLKNVITSYYEDENLNLAKLEQYIKQINAIAKEPKEFDTILIPTQLPSYFYRNNSSNETITFMESFNQVINQEEFEII